MRKKEAADAALERLLFAPAGFHEGSTKRLPDWTKVHEELKRRGVTLMILWEEHRAEHVDGHGYSRFCELYGEWRRRLSLTMRQTYVAGDKLFVDWARRAPTWFRWARLPGKLFRRVSRRRFAVCARRGRGAHHRDVITI